MAAVVHGNKTFADRVFVNRIAIIDQRVHQPAISLGFVEAQVATRLAVHAGNLHAVVAIGNGDLGGQRHAVTGIGGIDAHLGAIVQIESSRTPEIEAVLAVDVYMRIAVDQVILAGFLVVDMHRVVVAGIDLVIVILEHYAPAFGMGAGIGRIAVDGTGPVAAAGQNTIDCAHNKLLNKSYEKTNK